MGTTMFPPAECKVRQKWLGDASIILELAMPRTLWSVAGDSNLLLETGLFQLLAGGCRFENGAGIRHKERISRSDAIAVDGLERAKMCVYVWMDDDVEMYGHKYYSPWAVRITC